MDVGFELEIGFGDVEQLGGIPVSFRESVGIIGFVGRAKAKIPDESGIA